MQVDAEGLPVGGDQPERAERPEALIEAATRLVDLRGVARPPTFSGFTKDWSEFRFRMEECDVATWAGSAHDQSGDDED